MAKVSGSWDFPNLSLSAQWRMASQLSSEQGKARAVRKRSEVQSESRGVNWLPSPMPRHIDVGFP